MIKIFLVLVTILLAIAFLMIVQIWRAISTILLKILDLQDTMEDFYPQDTDLKLCKKIRNYYILKWKNQSAEKE